MACELLDDSAAGADFEVRLRKDGEPMIGRRCETEALAQHIARAFEQDARGTGYEPSSLEHP